MRRASALLLGCPRTILEVVEASTVARGTCWRASTPAGTTVGGTVTDTWAVMNVWNPDGSEDSEEPRDEGWADILARDAFQRETAPALAHPPLLWIAEQAKGWPANDRAQIFVVLDDGRQGVAWSNFSIQVKR